MTTGHGDMSIGMKIRTRVIQSPEELEDLLGATLRLAISNYVEMLLNYIEQHKSRGGSQYTEPKGTIPSATGETLQSMINIASGSHTEGLTAYFHYGIGTDNWPYIDQPRAPGHPPPTGAISTWAAIVGVPSTAVNLIRWHIYHYGWPGRQFWRPFAREANRSWIEAIEAAFNQVGIPFRWQGRDVVIL